MPMRRPTITDISSLICPEEVRGWHAQRLPGGAKHCSPRASASFGKRGVEKATVTEIAREAGVAQGTFYLYFHSKGDLVAALRQRFADRLAEVVSAQLAADAPADWFARLRGLLDAAADAYLANAPLHEVVFHDAAADRPDLTGSGTTRLSQGLPSSSRRAGRPGPTKSPTRRSPPYCSSVRSTASFITPCTARSAGSASAW